MQTMLGVAILHSMQAYELLCLDMPAEQAVLAAAAPPGLLDAARAVWAEAALQAGSASLVCCIALLCSAGCQFFSEVGAHLHKWRSLICKAMGPRSWLVAPCEHRLMMVC